MSQGTPTYMCCGARVGQPHWGIFGCPLPNGGAVSALLPDTERHQPRRDDDVAVWLQGKLYAAREGSRHNAIRDLLAEYCEKADYGLRLDEDGGDP